MKPKVRFIILTIVGILVLVSLITSKDYFVNPLRAELSDVRIGYTAQGGLIEFSNYIPITNRQLVVCGILENESAQELLITLEKKDGGSVSLKEYFYWIQPGSFCVQIQVLPQALTSGEFILKIVNEHDPVWVVDFEFTG